MGQGVELELGLGNPVLRDVLATQAESDLVCLPEWPKKHEVGGNLDDDALCHELEERRDATHQRFLAQEPAN